MRSTFLGALFVALLVGCAAGYQPTSAIGGFSETRISPDTFRIYFTGNGATSRERAEDFALLRAAELTINNGFTHFIVLSQSSGGRSVALVTPQHTTTLNPPMAQIGAQQVPLGISSSTTSGGYMGTAFKPEVVLTIQCVNGPRADGQAMDAQFLASSIRAKYRMK